MARASVRMRTTAGTLLGGGERGQGLSVADELVDISFARHLLHDAFLVVVAQGAAQFIVVHGRSVLLDAPQARHL